MFHYPVKQKATLGKDKTPKCEWLPAIHFAKEDWKNKIETLVGFLLGEMFKFIKTSLRQLCAQISKQSKKRERLSF